MTLVQLRHFVVLAEVGSFVQACKALFLTQPALTRSIQALEDELGGQLLTAWAAASRSHPSATRRCSAHAAWWPMPRRSSKPAKDCMRA
jgi:hypothetical protein